MSDKRIRIVVGASLDRDAADVFAPVRTSATRARKATESEMKGAGASVKSNLKKGIDPAEKSFKELEKWAKSAQRDIDRETKAAANALAKNIAKGTKDAARDLEKMATDAERASKRMIKAADASERRRGRALAAEGRENDRAIQGGIAGARRVGGMAVGAARTAVGFGARIAGDVARGAGADLDLGSQVAKNTSLQTQATNITNSGYMAGQAGPNGARQDPAALMKELSQTASETGFAVNDAAEGLAKFVSKTGDLETGRGVFKDLAVLSRATGTNLQDMVDAAGDVSNQLGDIPNKAEVINKVMRQIAGEGKLGAVEISDLAKQMAKVAAAASQFEGGHADAIGTLGMLAQEARAKGGAASASQAATATMSFANTFSKNARSKEFAAHGVKIDGANGAVRDPREIIIDALNATKGNKIEMGKMFMDAGARKVTRGFESIYNDAGGGAKGEEAVRAEFKRLGDVALQEGEIIESFNRSMKTAEAQANSFNNQMQMASGEIQSSITPALAGLAPVAIQLAQSMAHGIDLLTGRDPTKDRIDKAGNDVAGDLVQTSNQTGHGYILEEQLKKNTADEKAAEGAAADAHGAANAGKKSEYGDVAKGALTLLDIIHPAISHLITGSKKGLGAELVEKNKTDQDRLESTARAADKARDEIKANNDVVADLLRNHVISVKVVSAPPAPIKAPTQGGGKTPAGGEGEGT